MPNLILAALLFNHWCLIPGKPLGSFPQCTATCIFQNTIASFVDQEASTATPNPVVGLVLSKECLVLIHPPLTNGFRLDIVSSSPFSFILYWGPPIGPLSTILYPNYSKIS